MECCMVMNPKSMQHHVFEVGTPNDISMLVPASQNGRTFYHFSYIHLPTLSIINCTEREAELVVSFIKFQASFICFLLRSVSISQKHQDKYKLHFYALVEISDSLIKRHYCQFVQAQNPILIIIDKKNKILYFSYDNSYLHQILLQI